MVTAICWRILGREADAEDAMQDTFLKAYELSAKEPVRNWGGLLRRLATTTALARLRLRGRAMHSNVSDLPSREHSPADDLERQELEDRLRLGIANLPPRDAEVFCLRYLESLSHQEIAESLDLAYPAVTSAIYRARRRLEAEFADIRTDEAYR